MPPADAGLTRQPQAGERIGVRLLERRATPSAARSRCSTGRSIRSGSVEGVGDRHPHVRVAEMGQGRAVDEVDQRVDQRLRVDDDVDPLVRHPEQMVGLDQLEALVHQRRRVDRDLAAHLPGRMRERLLAGDRRRGRCGRGTGHPRRSGRDVRRHRAAPRRSAGGAPNARNRPGRSELRSPPTAPSRARRRRRGSPCWRGPARCPR